MRRKSIWVSFMLLASPALFGSASKATVSKTPTGIRVSSILSGVEKPDMAAKDLTANLVDAIKAMPAIQSAHYVEVDTVNKSTTAGDLQNKEGYITLKTVFPHVPMMAYRIDEETKTSGDEGSYSYESTKVKLTGPAKIYYDYVSFDIDKQRFTGFQDSVYLEVSGKTTSIANSDKVNLTLVTNLQITDSFFQTALQSLVGQFTTVGTFVSQGDFLDFSENIVQSLHGGIVQQW